MTRETPRRWTPLEEALINRPLLEVSKDKNPAVLKCPMCHRLFRFEDQVVNHAIQKHKKDMLHEILSLRTELSQVKEAMIAYRALARERREP